MTTRNDECPFYHSEFLVLKSPEQRARELSNEIAALPKPTRDAVFWMIRTLEVDQVVNSDPRFIEGVVAELSRMHRANIGSNHNIC